MDRPSTTERGRSLPGTDTGTAPRRNARASPRGTERSGEPPTDRAPLSVSLFARGSTDAKEREESVFERLRALRREGRIGEFSVRTWPAEVSVEGVGHSEVVDTFRTFEDWARRNDASIRPPFSIRERESAFTDRTDTLLVTPLVSLAVYDADGVVGVYPSRHGESVATIDDCLKWLASDDDPGVHSGDEPAEDRRTVAGTGRR